MIICDYVDIMGMFKIKDKQIIEFEKDLKAFAHRAFPFATKNTVNSAAFLTQKVIRKNLKTKMVLRNKFTVRSIRVDMAKTLVVRNQESVVGSDAGYMVDQEFGATKISKGSKGVVIHTGFSAGQQGQQPRTRLPRGKNKMKNIKLRRSSKKGVSRKQQNLIAIRQAAVSTRKYIYLDLGKSEGIFKVVGGKRKPRIKMVHDMSRQSVIIPRNPWLKPSFDRVVKVVPKIYRNSLIFQLNRHNLFKK